MSEVGEDPAVLISLALVPKIRESGKDPAGAEEGVECRGLACTCSTVNASNPRDKI